MSNAVRDRVAWCKEAVAVKEKRLLNVHIGHRDNARALARSCESAVHACLDLLPPRLSQT